ncbi:MAG: alpha/beta hydrolase [Deltaproteobacteria bacterium]|nr:alpha/beta hydrolase [Deltaproteobacteria bacterium]
MPRAQANGIEIEYEEFGDRNGRPLLLIMGLGGQMILWHEDLCEAFASRGFRVIRFDNRDVGRSTWFDHLGVPDIMSTVTAAFARLPINAPYLLKDMAADAVGLLDALGIDKAHIVGASMGGMIAQTLAIEFPSRALSLTSIMSTTGNPDLPQAKPEAMGVLLAPPPTNREESIERGVMVFRTIGSPGFPFDEADVRDRATRSFERGFNPAGTMRQLVAILASGSRTEKLRAVQIPALVVHGKDDPLVPLAGGEDTAHAIPGAQLMVIDGMGHDMPTAVRPRLVEAISTLAARA